MTDNEIIKALECCKTGDDCKGCPYYVNELYNCGEHFNEDVLDLINRQKAEIDMWKSSAELWEGDAKALFISRENIKAEAVKECIEKIKTRSSSCVATKDGIVIASSRTYTVSEVDLYEIEKEMVGE